MNIIKMLAVRSYRKELQTYKEVIDNSSIVDNSILVTYSTWLRAILQIEGILNPSAQLEPGCDPSNNEPELFAYPIFLGQLEATIKDLKKQNELSKVAVLMLWVHTLRTILNPSLNDQMQDVWHLLLDSKEHWDEHLEVLSNDDLSIGFEPEFVEKTLVLSRSILKNLPPKQLVS